MKLRNSTLMALAAAWSACGPSIPEVPVAQVARHTILSTVQTNGRIEPEEWSAVRAGQAGAVQRMAVELGDMVSRGSVMVELDAGPAYADLDAAEAQIAQAEAELAVLDKGGRASARVQLENDLESARLELEMAGKDLDVLRRLSRKQAATGQQVTQAESRVRKAELLIAAHEAKRETLVSPADRSEAEARLRRAQADAKLARRRISLARVRAPISGQLYRLAIKPGAYVNPGDLIAEIGQVERLRAVVYVDEPELGRVAIGMPVKITWDAAAEREWSGSVERMPTEIVAKGNRQVGEVWAVIDNAGRQLPAGANVTVEIRSRVAEGVPAIPKEALRRQGAELGVFVLDGEVVRWRPVELGTASITEAEVVSGVSAGDQVVLATEVELKDGLAVRAVTR